MVGGRKPCRGLAYSEQESPQRPPGQRFRSGRVAMSARLPMGSRSSCSCVVIRLALCLVRISSPDIDSRRPSETGADVSVDAAGK